MHAGVHAGADTVLDSATAAALLGVPVAALEAWSQRLSFPCDVGTDGAPRFRRSEVVALRDALPVSHSICGAIQLARRRLGA